MAEMPFFTMILERGKYTEMNFGLKPALIIKDGLLKLTTSKMMVEMIKTRPI